MSDHTPVDNRRARYLIAAAVLVLLLVVGTAYFIIVGVRGDQEDTGPETPTSQIVVPLVPAGQGR